MTDQWNDRLSDYLDDELDARRAGGARTAHLASCRECTATLDELREVVARAATLLPRPPYGGSVAGIAPRLDRATTVTPFRRARRPPVSFTMPQLVAAGLALMVDVGRRRVGDRALVAAAGGRGSRRATTRGGEVEQLAGLPDQQVAPARPGEDGERQQPQDVLRGVDLVDQQERRPPPGSASCASRGASRAPAFRPRRPPATAGKRPAPTDVDGVRVTVVAGPCGERPARWSRGRRRARS